MGKLSDKLKGDRNKVLVPKTNTTLWDGPCSSADNGGVSFSLLSRFLCCRERFRIQVVEGLKPRDTFDAKILYGSWWHECEEQFAKQNIQGASVDKWEIKAESYARELFKKYPASRDEINHWYSILLVQFPEYIEYWSKHSDVVKETVLEQEQVFNVAYKLPSGRTVYLKGKRDKVSLIGNEVWLQENKTKSQIDQYKIGRQLTYDLQVMLYLVSLYEDRYNKPLVDKIPKGSKLMGVRFNVIRRSAHKSSESMYKKMTEDIEAGRGGEWFSRWNVEITPQDIEYFKVRTLNPILEQLCDWWDWIQYGNDTTRKDWVDPFSSRGSPPTNSIHWQAPFGVYDVLKEGGSTDLDNYISTGSEIGLERAITLFPELE